jgi:hypothetical protein
MAGLVPAIHVFEGARVKTWMPGTSPGMTEIVDAEGGKLTEMRRRSVNRTAMRP